MNLLISMVGGVVNSGLYYVTDAEISDISRLLMNMNDQRADEIVG
jgi:hypothetical protein